MRPGFEHRRKQAPETIPEAGRESIWRIAQDQAPPLPAPGRTPQEGEGVGSHHLLPLTYVDQVTGDKVRLSITEDEAKDRWREMH